MNKQIIFIAFCALILCLASGCSKEVSPGKPEDNNTEISRAMHHNESEPSILIS